MSSVMFIDDVIKPIPFLLTFGLIFATWGLAIWKCLWEMRRIRQQEPPREEVQPLLEEIPLLAVFAMGRGEREAEEIILRLIEDEAWRNE